ncbi:ribonuclease H-like domain-containing protein [Clostridium sp. SYSU_GA19001]|uniref:ribonuclease H-like domain-containing protein n=1 Tax=Clostridium caldaquaticum TaxID=2940653 RepID=UPI002076EC65|nr:ribonuclease H-like domain-containing protein [Clostridium caldaquaticum]MCM8711672.1 ribonuclease H-like domain-containing protein [Clostridium caldaquaticum]
MLIKEYKDEIKIESHIVKKYNMHDIAYFDIETTGFDKDKDYIILISLGYFDEEGFYNIKQYYAEELHDEAEVLNVFASDLAKFNKWCSYNGMAFDEPFIIKRMEKYNTFFTSPVEHIDLYRLIRPYYKQLGMDRCNLKSVEKFLGVHREDQIDGAMSVELYYKYLETKDEELKDIIMLHNYEDVLNLPKIFKLIFDVENNSELVREDCITEKQLKFLKSLINKHNIILSYDVEKISKKSAAKIIDLILKGNRNSEELNNIIFSSY